jgi:hypothetical protein
MTVRDDETLAQSKPWFGSKTMTHRLHISKFGTDLGNEITSLVSRDDDFGPNPDTLGSDRPFFAYGPKAYE